MPVGLYFKNLYNTNVVYESAKTSNLPAGPSPPPLFYWGEDINVTVGRLTIIASPTPIPTPPPSAVADCKRHVEGRVNLKDVSGEPGLRYKRHGGGNNGVDNKVRNGVGNRVENGGEK